MTTIQITEANKYNTTDIAKWIRHALKQQHPDLKISVTSQSYSGGSSINISIMESKTTRFLRKIEEISESEIHSISTARNTTTEETIEFIKQRQQDKSHNVNEYHIDKDWQFTAAAKEKLKQILAIANKHNWDRSDPQTDYFDVNYYLHINLGKWDKPFKDGDN